MQSPRHKGTKAPLLVQDANSLDSGSDNEVTTPLLSGLSSPSNDPLGTNHHPEQQSISRTFLPNDNRTTSDSRLLLEDADNEVDTEVDNEGLPMVSYNNPVISETIHIDNDLAALQEEKRDRTKDEMTRVHPEQQTVVIENNLALDKSHAGPSLTNGYSKGEVEVDGNTKETSFVEDVEEVEDGDIAHAEEEVLDLINARDTPALAGEGEDQFEENSDARILERASSMQYVHQESEDEDSKKLFERAESRLYVHKISEDDPSARYGEYNPMRNWQRLEDQGDGVVRYETEDGPVRFMMEMGLEYPAPPNIFNLATGCELQDNPSLYLISSNCDFDIDNGVWRLELDCDYENNQLRMDSGDTLSDSTAKPVWKLQLESDIENLVRGYFVHKEADMDQTKPNWAIPTDTSYNPKSGNFVIPTDAVFVNVNIKTSLGKCGEIVQTRTRYFIPRDDLYMFSSFKDQKRFILNDDADLVNKDIGLTMFTDSEIVQQQSRYNLCPEGDIDNQGERYLICEGGDMSDEKPRYKLFEDEILEDIKLRFLLSDAELVDDTIQCLIPGEGIREDIRAYNICEDQVGRFSPARLLICDDIEKIDLRNFKIADGFDLVENETVFNLNQIEIDDEYLNDEDEDIE